MTEPSAPPSVIEAPPGQGAPVLTTRGSIPSTHPGQGVEAATAVLTFLDGLLAGQEFELTPQTTIGRKKECTIVLPAEERAVSALHCTVRRAASGLWIVEDADSAGGTFVNRDRVVRGARPVLSSGDVIGLGPRGPTATFSLRSSTFVGGVTQHVYAITLARSGVESPERHKFDDRPIVLLGRDRDCDIRFDPHGEREVSKRHARIRWGGRCFLLEDAGSSAGTLLNGVRVGAPALLRTGDIIELGPGGPKLVVEALEGVDDGREQAEAALDLARRVASGGGRRALLLGAGLVVITGGASFAVWQSSKQRADELAEGIQRAESRVDVPEVSTTQRFQEIAKRFGPATLLVHVAFHIEVEGVHDASSPFYEGDTFGSGFVISPRGLAVTNRHVIEPWLGDPEYADAPQRAKDSFGDAKVKVVSHVAAWQAGTEAIAGGKPDFTKGFNDRDRKNLTVVGFPPQHLVDLEFEGRKVKLVANDDTDLALVQLTGLQLATDAIPPIAGNTQPEALAPVVGLGFPAGATLLEGTTASLSPTSGEVRKVESTIQLSMPTFPGNSGGPVFDAEGHVIGVTTRRFGEGVAMCIPIEKVRQLLLHLGVAL